MKENASSIDTVREELQKMTQMLDKKKQNLINAQDALESIRQALKEKETDVISVYEDLKLTQSQVHSLTQRLEALINERKHNLSKWKREDTVESS